MRMTSIGSTPTLNIKAKLSQAFWPVQGPLTSVTEQFQKNTIPGPHRHTTGSVPAVCRLNTQEGWLCSILPTRQMPKILQSPVLNKTASIPAFHIRTHIQRYLVTPQALHPSLNFGCWGIVLYLLLCIPLCNPCVFQSTLCLCRRSQSCCSFHPAQD